MHSLFRNFKQTTLAKAAWLFLLSFVLISTQNFGVSFHIHNSEHTHQHNIAHIKTDVAHESQSNHALDIHLSKDSSHSHFDNEVLTELDSAQEGVIKTTTAQLVFALLVSFTLFIFALPLSGLNYRLGREQHQRLEYYALISPPLRAPPQ
jgi:hypothetical protein